MNQPKVFLVVLDGWGYSTIEEGNAILQAKKPNYDYFWQNYPHALIDAAGETVGLPWGSIGSSEVGHVTLGAGRIINQDFPKISKAIATGEIYKNTVLLDALEHARKNNSALHLVGLISAAGVHSHIEHLYGLLNLLKKSHFHGPSFIHMFTDGRDTPPKTALLYIDKVNQKIKELHLPTQISSVTGRYYAMDRDSHWERTYAAYEGLVSGKGDQAPTAKEAVSNAYERGITDEFIPPTTIWGIHQPVNTLSQLFTKNNSQIEEPKPLGMINSNDSVIFFNFRPERMRQLVETFIFPKQNYPSKKILKNVYYATLVEYDPSLPVKVVILPEKVTNPLAKIIAENGLSQLHIAETEKYAQATYFFDAGSPVPFKNEEWAVVPSLRIATFDLKPEMSAAKITDKLSLLTLKKQYDFVLINYANADIVGHTGKIESAIKAVEAIDKELGRLIKTYPKSVFLITADHGNAEKMIDPRTHTIDTEHSISPVPLLLIGPQYQKKTQAKKNSQPIGILADIAPTILDLLKISPPPEMTGYSLLKSLL